VPDPSLNIVEEHLSCVLTVRAVPGSSQSEIVGVVEGALKVRLNSPPVDGAANKELIKLIAKKLRIAKSAVTIVSGEGSRTKRLRIDGVDAASIRNALV
jgi:uncharacterized protein